MHVLYLLSTGFAVAEAAAVFPNRIEGRAPPAPSCSVVPIKPSPAGALCGVKGSLTTRNVIFRSKVATAVNPVDKCAELCWVNAACLSFAYKASEGLCRGFGSTLATQGIHDLQTSNGNLFYSRKCFQSKCPTPSSQCVAAALSSPTAITGYSDGTSDINYNNAELFNVPLPFEIGYGVYKSARAIMSINGMQINYGRDQGLFYEITGKAPNRIAKFEWRVTEWEPASEYGVQRYDSVLQLYEADSYSATFSYLKISDDGSYGLAGVRDGASGALTGYSTNQPGKLWTGLTVDVNNYNQTFVVNNLPLCSS